MSEPVRPILIRGATVLTIAHPTPFLCDILLHDGLIHSLGLMSTVPDGTVVIDAKGMIAFPGFVNAHIHLWQGGLRGIAGDWSFVQYFEHMLAGIATRMTPDDLRVGNEIGAWEQIEAGVTTLFDWSHALSGPEHADAALEGLEATGIRALFGYGPPSDVARWWVASTLRHPADASRLAKRLQGHSKIRLALAIRGPDFTDDDVTRDDVLAARSLGAIASMHVAVNPDADAPRGGVARMAAAGMLGPDVNFVHANQLSGDENQQVADCGATVTIAPEIEMQMGMGIPATGAVLRAGGRPSIGTDVAAAYRPDLFGQMRLALQVQRLADVCATRAPMQARDLLTMATLGGARALGMERQIGTLEPGKRADVILLRPGFPSRLTPAHDPFETVVLQSGVDNVDTVIIDGIVRKRSGILLGGPQIERISALADSAERLTADFAH